MNSKEVEYLASIERRNDAVEAEVARIGYFPTQAEVDRAWLLKMLEKETHEQHP